MDLHNSNNNFSHLPGNLLPRMLQIQQEEIMKIYSPNYLITHSYKLDNWVKIETEILLLNFVLVLLLNLFQSLKEAVILQINQKWEIYLNNKKKKIQAFAPKSKNSLLKKKKCEKNILFFIKIDYINLAFSWSNSATLLKMRPNSSNQEFRL